MDENEFAELIEESQRVLDELVRRGKARLDSGEILTPAPGELTRLIKDIALLRPPKKSKVPLPEGFLKKTAPE